MGFYNVEPDGPYCPVGPCGLDWEYIREEYTGHGEYFPTSPYYCSKCDSPLIVAKYVVFDPEDHPYVYEYWDFDLDSEYACCSNPDCMNSQKRIDCLQFMNGDDRFKDAGIPMKRPLSVYRNSIAEDKLVIASAALLDFEARCKESLRRT